MEAARIKLEQGHPDEALALLVVAMKADPESAGARDLAEQILRQTVWHMPLLTLRHPMPVDHIQHAAPGNLWIGLTGRTDTIVRWNLETLRIESVLFPIPDAQTRSLVSDATGKRLVVERAGILLLCDAMKLKPVKDLGSLPDFLTPSAVIVFSEDGLLMAHPALISEKNNSFVWHLRDAASGEILRTSDPVEPDSARPLAAFLDRRHLRVLHAHGGALEMPVSPAEEARYSPSADTVNLLHAQFEPDGVSALALVDRGPHQRPSLSLWRDGAILDDPPDLSSLLERFPWNRHPGIWTGLLRECPRTPLSVDKNTLFQSDISCAPIRTSSTITAVAAVKALRFVGEENGTLSVHRMLPLPRISSITPTEVIADEQSISALSDLTEIITGIRHPENGDTAERIDAGERMGTLGRCDFAALARLFPSLYFSPLAEALKGISLREPDTDAMSVLTARLARADGSNPEAASSPAARLALALESTMPGFIKECLASSPEMPPLLRKLSLSRIAWLEDRKADALAGWPEVFPEIGEIRKREDWDGWEQADFSMALEKVRQCISDEVSALKIPENASSEQKQEVIKRLMNADTLRTVGPSRLARASLDAAVALADSHEEAEAALHLAELARNLGHAPEPCLRTEARALGTLGDYQKARDRWVLLITDHPVDMHLSRDYAEAAYTAFECADPNQAMEILTTGLHRFQGDADFALRAGWIALLAGSPDRAGRFLLAGREAGFAPEKLEYATALLTIAATQNGAIDDAAVFRNDLLRLNPAWGEQATIDALDWPEEFKSALLTPEW